MIKNPRSLVVITGGTALCAGLFLIPAEARLTFSGSGTTSPADSYVDYCPTREEVDAHWRQTGRDLKPTVFCDDEDPLETSLTPPGADHSHEPGAAQESGPRMTLAEAQAQYDPHNDPYTLVGRNPDGTIALLTIAAAVPPPPWVKTPADLSKWVALLDAASGQ